MSKYLYTAQDVALFFDYSDLKLSFEKKIKEDLWQRRKLVLDPKYRENKNELIKEISKCRELSDYKEYKNELDIINRIFKELGSEYKISKLEYDSNYIEAFFRFIKLRLTYTENCLFIRIKLRTLLRNFGYKRRSVVLVNDIKRSMKALKLEAYLRDYQPCDIADIELDDVIIIRLKAEN